MAWVYMTVKLTELGFVQGVICETILSTYEADGGPNAAPMGVIMQDPQTISINLYNTSSTYRNLQANKCAVINLTSNIELFYKTTFKETNPKGKLPAEWFEEATTVNAPKLRSTDGTIAISVTSMESIGSEKTKVVCSVKSVNAAKKYPQVSCRAMSATLEAIIHATRVKAFVEDKTRQEQLSKLLQLIGECNDVVNRVAPNSVYSTIMDDLTKRIDSWRRKQ